MNKKNIKKVIECLLVLLMVLSTFGMIFFILILFMVFVIAGYNINLSIFDSILWIVIIYFTSFGITFKFYFPECIGLEGFKF